MLPSLSVMTGEYDGRLRSGNSRLKKRKTKKRIRGSKHNPQPIFLKLPNFISCLYSEFIYSCRQLPVFFGYNIAGIMCIEMNGHFIVHIVPVGMMIHFFGSHSHAGHECKGFYKISEYECFCELVVFFFPHLN